MSETFYGQHGEDYLICQILKNINNGVFIEVGCVDGLRFSNTLKLSELGWSGICVEPHPHCIDLVEKNREECDVFGVAAGSENGETEFYAEKRGSLSSVLSPSERPKFGNLKYQKVKVPMKTLNSIIQDSNYNEIDFVSIDVESYELNVLRGFDVEKYQPLLIVIEENDNFGKIEEKLNSYYTKQFKIGSNIFFVLDDFELPKIDLDSSFELQYTIHPLDNDAKHIKKYKLDAKIYDK